MAHVSQTIQVELSQSAERKIDKLIRAVERLNAKEEKAPGPVVFPLDDEACLSEEEKLRSFPIRTVIAGPEWHDEIYQKSGEDDWYPIGSNVPWTTAGLATRGPFHVLRRGR